MLTRWPHGFLLHQWLVFAAAVGFALYLAWDMGLVSQLLANDATRLSIVILALLGVGLIHGAQRAIMLSRELDTLYRLLDEFDENAHGEPVGNLRFQCRRGGSLVHSYIDACAKALGRRGEAERAGHVSQNLSDVFQDRVNASYEFGWFLANLSIKLGLLGTVVGFILMLRSAVVIESIEFSTVQTLLADMTAGMGVALNTTLAGLVTSAVLSIQYLWLDYGARRLIADSVFFVERDLAEELYPGETTAASAQL